MKNLSYLCPIFLILLSGLLLLTSCDREEEAPDSESSSGAPRWVTIATDEATRLSHVTGVSIAEIAGKKVQELGFRVRVKQTPDPVSSLNAVRAGDSDFAVVGSDMLFQAVTGTGAWENQEGQHFDLLAVFTVHAEMISVMTADDSGIEKILDLRGKRVSIGKQGSRERRSSVHILESAGLDIEKNIEVVEVETVNAPAMLEDGRIEAYFVTAEHPNDNVRTATTGSRNVRFVPITNVASLLRRHPYYIRTKIPLEMYPGVANREDVDTIGYKISLVASKRTPRELVSSILGEVFDNIEILRDMHPSYQSLTKPYMTEGMYQVIHPGALIYYMKNGFRLRCCFYEKHLLYYSTVFHIQDIGANGSKLLPPFSTFALFPFIIFVDSNSLAEGSSRGPLAKRLHRSLLSSPPGNVDYRKNLKS
jgi:TRAP transporter TAXI family solute receptor